MTVSAAVEQVVLAARRRGESPRAVRLWTGISASTQKRILSFARGATKAGHSRCAGVRAPAKKLVKRRKLVDQYRKATVCVGGDMWPQFSSCKAVKSALSSKHGIAVHRETIRRDMQKLGAVTRVRRYVPTHPYKERTEFCRKWSAVDKKTVEEAKYLCFSDEHEVTTNSHGSRLQWIIPEKEMVLPRVKQDTRNLPRFMIWAAIGFNYRSKCVILPIKDEATGKGWRMNADKYIELCLTKDFISASKKHKFVFMQDGARCHTAKLSMEHLRASGVVVLPFWPPHSPDLNPIENLWALLDDLIAQRGPTTLDELKKATLEAWDSIPVSTMNKFVLSFQHKCRNTVAKEAGKERNRVMRKLGRPVGSKNKPKAVEKKPTAKKLTKKHAK